MQKKVLSDAKKEVGKDDIKAIIKGSLISTGFYTEEELNAPQKIQKEYPVIFGRYDFDISTSSLYILYHFLS